jgi:hypothetical protein
LHGRNEPSTARSAHVFDIKSTASAFLKKVSSSVLMRKVAAAQLSSPCLLLAISLSLSLPCQINLPPVKLNDIYSGPADAIWQLGPTHSGSSTRCSQIRQRWRVRERCARRGAAGCLHLEANLMIASSALGLLLCTMTRARDDDNIFDMRVSWLAARHGGT